MENKSEPGSSASSFISEWEPALDKLAKSRSVIPVAFILVVLFFFFGFCNFKCNGTKVASLKGIQLVTGTRLKTQVGMSGGHPFGMMNNSNSSDSSSGQKIPASFWAILALASAVVGFIVFYRKEKREALFGILLAASGFISLFILRLVIKDKVESQGSELIRFEASFLFGYWAALLAFFVAGGISYLRYRKEQMDETTPPDKPPGPTQIHVNIITQHTEPD